MFAGLALILLAIIPPGTPSGDGASMLEVADGLATGPTFAVGCDAGIAGRGGECFSNFYPLISLLAAPLVFLGREIAPVVGAPPEYAGHILALVVPALATAGAATLAADLAQRLGAGRTGGISTAAAVAFGTEMLTYSRSFYAETLVAFCAVLAVWGLTGCRPRQTWLGLLGITLAVLAKPQVALFGLAIGLALAIRRRSPRPLVETGLATGVGALLLFAYNWHRFADPLDFGGEARTLDPSAFLPPEGIEALGLLTVSPGRGFIWFSPVAVLGLYLLWVRRRGFIPFVCLLTCAGLAVLYIGNPGAGFNWGSRYLVALLPLLCVPLGALRGRMATFAIVLAVLGLAMQAPNLVGFYHRYHREQADIRDQAQGLPLEFREDTACRCLARDGAAAGRSRRNGRPRRGGCPAGRRGKDRGSAVAERCRAVVVGSSCCRRALGSGTGPLPGDVRDGRLPAMANRARLSRAAA